VEIVNGIMKLSAEDVKKFWPIYREYENDVVFIDMTIASEMPLLGSAIGK
jgi:hypothetical protein